MNKGAEERVGLTATQRTIARRMVESTTTIPHFELDTEIDMTAVVALRESWRAQGVSPLPTFNDFMIHAVAVALRSFPSLNASYDDRAIVRYSRVNVGTAIALEASLVVPVIFDVDTKSLFEIAAESRLLAERARSKSLSVEELTQGTFTVSNLGMFGVKRFSAVINPPQACILAVGEVAPRPVVAGDRSVAVRDMVDVTLACDHRIVYGADGARFLQRLRELLEGPSALTAGVETREPGLGDR